MTHVASVAECDPVLVAMSSIIELHEALYREFGGDVDVARVLTATSDSLASLYRKRRGVTSR